MNNIKKPLLISPLLGAIFLTVLCVTYILLFVTSFNMNNIYSLFKILPILFIVFSIVSYIISVPLNVVLYKKMENDLKDDKFFVNMSLFSGFIISLILSVIDYNFHQSVIKSLFIIFGMSLMTTINANYFLVLAKIITIKDKQNEKTK